MDTDDDRGKDRGVSMLDEGGWRKPLSVGDGSTPSKDFKADTLAQALLNELSKQQADHENRIEVLLTKQEQSISLKLAALLGQVHQSKEGFVSEPPSLWHSAPGVINTKLPVPASLPEQVPEPKEQM